MFLIYFQDEFARICFWVLKRNEFEYGTPPVESNN